MAISSPLGIPIAECEEEELGVRSGGAKDQDLVLRKACRVLRCSDPP